MKLNKKIYLSGLTHYHPDGVLDNQTFQDRLDTTDTWIRERTGIITRRYMSDYTGTLPTFEMADRVLLKAIDEKKIDLDEIDYLITCGSMDDLNYPSCANLLAEKYKLEMPALRVSAACASVVYAIEIGSALIKSEIAKNILVVNPEPFTRQVDYGDRSSAILFGDAATAFVLTDKKSALEVIDVKTSGKGLAIVKSDRVSETTHLSVLDFIKKSPPTGVPAKNRRKKLEFQKFEQDGKQVSEFVLRNIPKFQKEFLLKAKKLKNEIQWIVFHQANLALIKKLAAECDFDEGRHLYNVDRFGNTSSAGAFSVVSESLELNRFRLNDQILLTTFGAGMCWGNLLLKRC